MFRTNELNGNAQLSSTPSNSKILKTTVNNTKIESTREIDKDDAEVPYFSRSNPRGQYIARRLVS